MLKAAKMVRVTEAQISLVLDAVAHLEHWDAAHRCIESDTDGGWRFLRVNGMASPMPSEALLKRIRETDLRHKLGAKKAI